MDWETFPRFAREPSFKDPPPQGTTDDRHTVECLSCGQTAGFGRWFPVYLAPAYADASGLGLILVGASCRLSVTKNSAESCR